MAEDKIGQSDSSLHNAKKKKKIGIPNRSESLLIEQLSIQLQRVWQYEPNSFIHVPL